MPHIPQDQDFAAMFLNPKEEPKNAPTVTQEPRLELLTEEKKLLGPEDEQPSGEVTRRNIFRHPDAHPIVLDLLLMQRYGIEWLDWEPETIELKIEKGCKCELSTLNLSKIQALKAMHLVDSFWQRWEVFVWCTMPLNDIYPDFEIMQVPSVAQCMISVDIANRVRDDVSWSVELLKYLELVHRHDGIMVPQAPLDFVEVDTVGYPLDAESIKKRWPSIRNSGDPPGDGRADDYQLTRMLEVFQYMREYRERLRQQLRVVFNA